MDGITALAQRVATLQQTLAPPAAPQAPAPFRAQLDAAFGAASLRPAAPPPLTSLAAPPGLAEPAAGTGDRPLLTPVEGRLTSEFGPRVHPVTGEHRPHHGLDLAAPTGTPIRAAAGGVVTFAGQRGGYGNLVIVDHGNGLETRYAHQDRLSVRTGDAVAAGAALGAVGSTGLSTGPHLHFEVRRDGEAVDPAPYLGL